ncbi:putative hydrolase of the HAD superfamily [Kitasatospora gansuensis]|uniref:Putative hydrolase of the HAD superfamily n=1 Tax=Kitasatospora gansuensis TaxID=258050 RepID=A0A7W7SGX5_9ACTN|nr:HAD-IA family hydrolase [Kitasatospora gansuensis]MBB4950268.1 putative hydrolase of the HAD superfamily [Kitasatospora gansuensis]
MTLLPHPRTPGFDAVLCDIDGVIRFFDHTEVARLELAAGLPPGSTSAVAFGPETALPLILGQLTKEQWRDSITTGLATLARPAEARALATAFTGSPVRADQEVVELLRRARAHCPVLLVTNATPWLDDDLTRLGLADLADGAVNSALVGAAKPDRLIYQVAADRAGVAPERCLFVDDRRENVVAAEELGMTGVHFRGPADLRAALAPLSGLSA